MGAKQDFQKHVLVQVLLRVVNLSLESSLKITFLFLKVFAVKRALLHEGFAIYLSFFCQS